MAKEIPLTDAFIASIAKTSACDAWIDRHLVVVTDVFVKGNGTVTLGVAYDDGDTAVVKGETVTVYAATLLDIIKGRLAHSNVCDCSQHNDRHDGTCEAGKLIGAQLKISMHKG